MSVGRNPEAPVRECGSAWHEEITDYVVRDSSTGGTPASSGIHQSDYPNGENNKPDPHDRCCGSPEGCTADY